MAELGLRTEFEANHGSNEIKTHKFTIDLFFKGNITNGFVNNLDHTTPKQFLNQLNEKFEGAYLDKIVGRATIENIAMYILNELKDLNPDSINVREGNEQFIKLNYNEMDFKNFPSRLEFNFGNSLLCKSKPENAIHKFDTAIKLNPAFAEAYNLRGRCYKYLDKYDIALENYETALSLNPELHDTYRNIGNALLYLDRFDEMMNFFDKAVEFMPNSALAINNRAFGCLILKDFKNALKDSTKAIQLDPNYAEAYKDQSEAYKALGMIREAKQSEARYKELVKTKKDSFAHVKMY